MKALKEYIEELEELALRSREPSDPADVFFMCIDRGTHFIEVNNNFIKALGWTKKELMKESWIGFIHPDDREVGLQFAASEVSGASFSAACCENASCNCFFMRYRKKDGDYRWLQWVGSTWKERGISFSVAVDVTDDPNYADTLIAIEAERKSLRRVI